MTEQTNGAGWQVRPPEQPEIGTEEGDVCGRYPEPDEDQPRGYRPKPCDGVMEVIGYFTDSWIECDKCGKTA